MLWLRPGQVHQFDGVEDVQGTLALFQPDFLAPGTLAQAAAEDTFGPTLWRQPATSRPLAALALEHLRREYAEGESDPFPTRIELLRQLLGALVLRLLSGVAAGAGGGGAADDDTFRRGVHRPAHGPGGPRTAPASVAHHLTTFLTHLRTR
ncbi:hypothetical protein AB0M29_40385 [Streptomyces sp. NPDC051976]|uniref:hypothetical protein n=1 Tax=Streptomyces sp. NPDC051976 TaxID=3154947 RepID=UPI003429996D